MKKNFLILSILFFSIINTQAQVGNNETGAAPSTSAMYFFIIIAFSVPVLFYHTQSH